MRSTKFMQTDRWPLRPCFCVDLQSDLSLPTTTQRHRARSLNAFALRLRASSLRLVAHICARTNVQMACPERGIPKVWLALVGRQAARDAAPPGHRRPVPSGRGKVQGKIEGSGTLPAHKRVCTWGWRGTRHLAAPCRDVCQSLVAIGETACMARPGRMALAGVSA